MFKWQRTTTNSENHIYYVFVHRAEENTKTEQKHIRSTCFDVWQYEIETNAKSPTNAIIHNTFGATPLEKQEKKLKTIVSFTRLVLNSNQQYTDHLNFDNTKDTLELNSHLEKYCFNRSKTNQTKN